ncbi:MAG: hypothetical protein ACP5P4_05150 [Steroidobacteraceae bacterium]
MSGPFATLLLDTVTWDLVIDSNGNIAMATPPYSVSQDVASAVRTFLGDAYYDQTVGIDYLGTIFGHAPPLPVFQAAIEAAALTVPGVVSAQCSITGIVGRKVAGQVTFGISDGTTGSVTL